jgi:hypothetical protein
MMPAVYVAHTLHTMAAALARCTMAAAVAQRIPCCQRELSSQESTANVQECQNTPSLWANNLPQRRSCGGNTGIRWVASVVPATTNQALLCKICAELCAVAQRHRCQLELTHTVFQSWLIMISHAMAVHGWPVHGCQPSLSTAACDACVLPCSSAFLIRQIAPGGGQAA